MKRLLNALPASCILLLFTVACTSTQEAAVPDTPSPAPVAQAAAVEAQAAAVETTALSAITHRVQGREECLACHGVGATRITDVPDTHEGRGDDSCMWCHASDSPMLTMTPTATPHARSTAETDCMRCHAPDGTGRAGAVPETHQDRGNGTCLWCHKKAGAG